MGEIPAFTIKCTFSTNAFFKREILQVKKNLFAKMCANTQIIDVPFSAVLGIIRCEIGIAQKFLLQRSVYMYKVTQCYM